MVAKFHVRLVANNPSTEMGVELREMVVEAASRLDAVSKVASALDDGLFDFSVENTDVSLYVQLNEHVQQFFPEYIFSPNDVFFRDSRNVGKPFTQNDADQNNSEKIKMSPSLQETQKTVWTD